MSKFVNKKNAHRPDTSKVYESVIRKIQQDSVCPFCQENLHKYHKKPILHQSKYWVATNNMYPYLGSTEHILIINAEHKEDVTELSDDEWLDLRVMVKTLTAMQSIKGATLLLRFGDTDYTGASVSHLHAHLVSGSDNPGNDPILARVGNK
jgi:ATP adenylyltransferase